VQRPDVRTIADRWQKNFEKRFTARRMAEDYLHYYKALMQQGTSDTPLH
jgi:hypothetical protein